MTSVKVEQKTLTAFNLSIADHHTFFIANAGVLVKNCDVARAAELAKQLPAACKARYECKEFASGLIEGLKKEGIKGRINRSRARQPPCLV